MKIKYINSIALGDCIEIMKDIPSESIDAIICDLPYGVLNRNNKDATWDNIINPEELFEQYRRIAKDSAPIVLFGQGMFTAQMMIAGKDIWRYNLIWEKTNVTGFLDANRRPLRCHEDIMVFSKAGYHTYNPQMELVDWHLRSHHKRGGNHNRTNRCYGKIIDMPSMPSNEKFPRSIILFGKSSPEQRDFHPTQKPLDLMRYLIRTYSNEGDVILDNCCGSGTTCVAAMKEKRQFIGIELNEEYFNIATRRIKDELAKPTLF